MLRISGVVILLSMKDEGVSKVFLKESEAVELLRVIVSTFQIDGCSELWDAFNAELGVHLGESFYRV